MQIFVGYSRKNWRIRRMIVRDLRAIWPNGVWYDKKQGGGDWWSNICKEILSREVFLPLISKEWLESDVCQDELSYAVALRRHIQPIRIDDTPHAILPKALRRIHIVDYRHTDAPDRRLRVVIRATIAHTVTLLAPLPDPLPEMPPHPHERAAAKPSPQAPINADELASLYLMNLYRSSAQSLDTLKVLPPSITLSPKLLLGKGLPSSDDGEGQMPGINQ